MKKNGKAVAGMIAGSLAMLSIGVMHLLAESLEAAHDFLGFIPGYGTLSGKIIIAYLLGLVSYLILSHLLKNKNPRLLPWVWIAVASLLLSSLFVFTPFVKLVAG